MKIISLTNSDELVQVSDEDYDFLNQWNWQIDKKKSIRRCEWINGIKTVIIMSRAIAERIGLDLSGDIDHEDRDPTNNERENLRAATRSQNQANVGLRKDNTTGYKGVHFHTKTQKYIAYINVNGKRFNLGYYFYAVNAAQAYDRAAIKYFDKFAWTNFPKENYI